MSRVRKGGTKTAIISDSMQPVQKTGRTISADGLENCISGMGTNLDKRSYTKYQYVRPFVLQELEAMYRQSWLIKRIVNIVPHDMTRKWREFNLDSPLKIKKLKAYEKKIKLRQKFIDGLIYGRLFGGALGVMITDDMDFNDPETCSTPLDINKIKKDSLKNILIYDRWRCFAEYELVSDIESPDFEMPMYYRITSNPQANPNAPRIHHTRILRFDGERIPYYAFTSNARWHDSVVQHVYDSVVNNESAKQNVSSMMYESTVDCYKYAGLRETLADSADGDTLVAQRLRVTNMSKSVNRAIVLDAEDSFEKKSNSFSGLDKILKEFAIDVCGAARIPMTKLFGQSESGLNSSGESDENKYYDDLSSSQENDLRPILEKLDPILVTSALGKLPDDYSFEFPSLWQESDVDKAVMEYNNAQRDVAYLTSRVISPQNVADKLLTDKIYNKIDVPEPEEIEQDPINGIDKTPKTNNKQANKKNDKTK